MKAVLAVTTLLSTLAAGTPLWWCAPAHAAGAFKIVRIEIPAGSNSTTSVGITEDGTVIGCYLHDGEHVFTARNGVVQSIATPKGFDAAPTAVSAHGAIAGGLYPRGSYYATGFLYLDGQLTRFNYPGAVDLHVTGVNDAGDVAGFAYVRFPENTKMFFLLHGGSFTTLPFDQYSYIGGINNAGQIVGTRETNTSSAFFTYNAGVITTVAAPKGTFVFQNNNGEIAGNYVTDAGARASFRYAHGALVPIFPSDKLNVDAAAINDAGRIAGTFDTTKAEYGFSLMGHDVTFTAPPQAGGLTVTGLNDAGQITGYWVVGEGHATSFVATPKKNF